MKGSRKQVGESQLAKNIDRMFGASRRTLPDGEAGPRFHSKDGHSVCVEQLEYVGDVISTGSAFQSIPFNINSGIARSFPQLCQIASLYEQYCFVYLDYEYRPMVYDQISSATNSLGVVGMVVQYDPSDLPFVSKITAENWEGCETVKPSDSMVIRVDCGRRRTKDNILMEYYTRSGQQALNVGIADLRMYDVGTLNLFTYGQQAAQTLGELWVRYKVCFYKNLPVQPTVPGNVLQSRYYNNFFKATPSSDYWGITGQNTGSPTLAFPGSNVPITFVAPSTLYFPSWLPIGSSWQLSLYWTVNSPGAWTAATSTLDAGFTELAGGVGYFASNASGSGGNRTYVFNLAPSDDFYCTYNVTFTVTGNPASPNLGYSAVFSNLASPGGVAMKFDLQLTQLLDTYIKTYPTILG